MAKRSIDCLGGCGDRVDRNWPVCKPCTRRLPKPLRQALNNSGRRRGHERLIAIHSAAEWFAAHPARMMAG